MEFSTDYMKLIQLLDDGLINRMNESKPAKLLERDLEKAKQVKTLLESMIEDKSSLKDSLFRLLGLDVRTGLLNRLLGNRPNQVQSTQNNIDRLNCLVMLDKEADFICDLGELLTKVSAFLDENNSPKTFDDGERA